MTGPIIDASTPAERENVDRVLAFCTDVLGKRDPVAVADHVAADFVQHNPFYGTGRDGLAQFLTGPLLTACPDLTPTAELAIAQRDRVLVYLIWRGRHAATGATVDFGTADLYRLRNGRLAEHWDVVEWHELAPIGFPRPPHDQPTAEPDPAGTEAQQANLALLRRYTDEVTVQDYSRAHLFIRRDFVQHDPMIPPGLDGFKACCDIFRGMAEDMHVVVRHLIVGTDHVGAIWDWTGHQDGTGAPVLVPTSDVYRLEAGLLTEHWDRIDYTFVTAVLGYNPRQFALGGR